MVEFITLTSILLLLLSAYAMASSKLKQGGCDCRACQGDATLSTGEHAACPQPQQVKVTHVDNFWKTVEMSAATGHVMPANTAMADLFSPVANAWAVNLGNTVIILPRIVTRLHPVHEYQEEHVYNNLVAWDVDFVIQMLQRFLHVSSTNTVPSLAEYRILPDKVGLPCPALPCLSL